MDSLESVPDRLDCDSHVIGIAMHDRCLIAHDGNVALPEQKIAAAQPRWIERRRHRRAERAFLHVAVARAGDTASRERNLNEAGAVEAKTRPAAPEIGHAEKFFGNGDEVRLVAIKRHNMAPGHMAAGGRHRKNRVAARDRDPATERERLNWWQ